MPPKKSKKSKKSAPKPQLLLLVAPKVTIKLPKKPAEPFLYESNDNISIGDDEEVVEAEDKLIGVQFWFYYDKEVVRSKVYVFQKLDLNTYYEMKAEEDHIRKNLVEDKGKVAI